MDLEPHFVQELSLTLFCEFAANVAGVRCVLPTLCKRCSILIRPYILVNTRSVRQMSFALECAP